MSFWVVSGVGRGMGVLDGGGDRRRRGICSFEVNLGHPIVTNGTCESDALFPNYFGKTCCGGRLNHCQCE